MKLRIMEIIQLLLEQDSTVTINEIADALSVSNKTVRNDFKKVIDILDKKHLKLIKKAGVGVFIEGTTKAKLAMLAESKSYKVSQEKLNSRDRQSYILFQLLSQNKTITIGDLEEELFISRPSVYKDMDKVKDWLEVRNIQLIFEPRIGYHIESGEKRIRKSLFDLFLRCSKQDRLINLFKSKYEQIDFYTYDQKYDLYDVDENIISKAIKKYESESGSHFTSDGLSRLTIKYAIALSRIQSGHQAAMRASTVEELRNHRFYNIFDKTIRDLLQDLSIKIKDEEISYLFGTTLGTGTHYEENKSTVNADVMTINRIIANEIVSSTKKYFRIDHEEAFFNGLFHHLKTVMNKMKYSLDFHNTHLDEIKKDYPEAYRIAVNAMRVFEELYNREVPEEEAGYIALHIASAIERSKKPLSVCVIYNHSYSEIKLMLEFLHNRYRQLDIQMVYPLSLFKEALLDKYDLIITTSEIKDVRNERLVVLPGILIHKDMRQFEILLNDIYEKHNQNLLKK